ncbi:MAG: arylsulfatase [Planctomycetota bacterium]
MSLDRIAAHTLDRAQHASRLALAALLATPMLVEGARASPAAQEAAQRPNIIIVYADDMGFGDLGAQNPASKIPTPNMDRLAREGTRFNDAHSSSGICTPSRFALLTGTHHWRRFHGIVNSFEPSVFTPEDVTLAELLRSCGYDTACIGKWHLGWDWAALRRAGAEPTKAAGYAPGDFDWSLAIPDGPLAHGFDHYFGDDVPNFPPYTWIRDDHVVTPPTLPLTVSPRPTEGMDESRPGPMAEGWRQDMVMPRLTARVVEWLREPARRERPFFLYWPWTAPHAPITPSGEFRGSTEAGGYGDYLHQSDAHLGQVLNTLDELRLAGDTLVIFTSDNGPEHYAYARVRDRDHRSMGPLRGLKRDIFEGGHHVPFVVRWPGVVPAGRACSALIGQVDIWRTIASIVGFEATGDSARDSIDQLAVWRGEVEAARSFHVHNTFADRWAIRSGDWVLIDAADGAHSKVPDWFREREGLPRETTPGLLYDLSLDPGQRNNVFGSHPDVVASLRSLLAHERNR